jgi:hypothetical protein
MQDYRPFASFRLAIAASQQCELSPEMLRGKLRITGLAFELHSPLKPVSKTIGSTFYYGCKIEYDMGKYKKHGNIANKCPVQQDSPIEWG